MKALYLETADGPESVSVREVETPTPKAGEVRVAIKAASLNHRELWIPRGEYPGMVLPATLGCDGAGVVDMLGDGVTSAKIGDEVVLYPGLNWGPSRRTPARISVCSVCLALAPLPSTSAYPPKTSPPNPPL